MRAAMFSAVLLWALAIAGCGTGGTAGSGSNPPSGSAASASGQAAAGEGGSVAGEAASGSQGGGSEAPSGAARCYVGAVNAEDLDALVGCFAPDGVVVDVSRSIEGRDAIREWAHNEVIGGTLRVIESEPRPNGVRLLVHWAPAGSDGWRAYYTFEARDGRIALADLQYA